MQVERGELRVVVEHLLEVRHQPERVHGVAREAAAELVVHPAARHLHERRVHHAPRVRVVAAARETQYELPDHRLRKLRRAAEPPVLLVELRRHALERREEDLVAERRVRRAQTRFLAERAGELAAVVEDVGAAIRPRLGQRLQQARKAGQAVTVRRREIRPAVERRAVGREEDGHRPAALPRHRLHGLHIDVIDVGALLAIDLDAHEVAVHHGGGVGVLERLALHHVTPVAGGVADGQQNRLVFRLGARESLLAPRIPIDGVVRVLKQVRARLAGQAIFADGLVAHGGLSARRASR